MSKSKLKKKGKRGKANVTNSNTKGEGATDGEESAEDNTCSNTTVWIVVWVLELQKPVFYVSFFFHRHHHDTCTGERASDKKKRRKREREYAIFVKVGFLYKGVPYVTNLIIFI